MLCFSVFTSLTIRLAAGMPAICDELVTGTVVAVVTFVVVAFVVTFVVVGGAVVAACAVAVFTATAATNRTVTTSLASIPTIDRAIFSLFI